MSGLSKLPSTDKESVDKELVGKELVEYSVPGTSVTTAPLYYLKMKYTDGQFLRAEDFQDEQEYHSEKLMNHNRTLHGFGICDGLNVTVVTKIAGGAISMTGSVKITKGSAVDFDGRSILLPQDVTLDLSKSCKPGDSWTANINLYIHYGEANAKDRKEGGFDGFTRITEKPRFYVCVADSSAADSNMLLLATIRRNRLNGIITTDGVNTTGRRTIGAITGYTGLLTANSVDTTHIKNNAVTVDKIANGAITEAKLASAAGGIIGTAHLKPGVVTADKLAPGVVIGGGGQINDGSVTTVKIADNAVTTAKIANNAVSAAKIANDAVTTNKIANGNITNGKLVQNTLQTWQMANASVNTGAIQTYAVTENKLKDGAVTAKKIASGAVTAAKMNRYVEDSGKQSRSATQTVAVTFTMDLSEEELTLPVGAAVYSLTDSATVYNVYYTAGLPAGIYWHETTTKSGNKYTRTVHVSNRTSSAVDFRVIQWYWR